MTEPPVRGTLIALARINLIGTLIGLAVVTPVFLICGPIIVCCSDHRVCSHRFLVVRVGRLTGLTSFSWFARHLWQPTEEVPRQLEEFLSLERKKRLPERMKYRSRSNCCWGGRQHALFDLSFSLLVFR
ncbi:unnamed protein product [Linum tenue]|nr:unnamed protein product [Linum tenue]